MAFCLTDLASGEYRNSIKTLITQNGGSVHRTLIDSETKAHVNYLVVASPESPHSQMRTPEKLNYARTHGIKVVWEKWLHATIEKGGRLPCCDEYWKYLVGQPEPAMKDYEPTAPAHLHGKNALKRDRDEPSMAHFAIAAVDDDEKLVMANKRIKARMADDTTDKMLEDYRTLKRSTTATIDLGESTLPSLSELRAARSEAVLALQPTEERGLLRKLGSTRSTSFRPASPVKPKRIVQDVSERARLSDMSPEPNDDHDNDDDEHLVLRDMKVFFANDHKPATNEKMQQFARQNGALVTTDTNDIPHVDCIVVAGTNCDKRWLADDFVYADKLAAPAYIERCLATAERTPIGDSFFDRPLRFRCPHAGTFAKFFTASRVI